MAIILEENYEQGRPPPPPQLTIKAITLSIVCFVVLLSLLAAPLSAFAASGISPNGMSDPNQPVTLTPAEQLLLQQKWSLANEHAQVIAGKEAPTIYQQHWDVFAKRIHLQFGPQYTGTPHAGVQPALCPSVSAIQPYTGCNYYSHTLGVTTITQKQPYYCGPATVQEMLTYLGWTTGPHGENLNASPYPLAGQQVLANTTYLNTDYNNSHNNGATNWGDGTVPATLNAWIGSNYYVALNGLLRNGQPTIQVTDYENAMTIDIDSGYPVAAGIHEDTSTPHLTGHTGLLVKVNHWIALTGYSAYGGNTTYDDSINGVPSNWGWPYVPPSSTVSSKTVMYPLILPYGIVW